MTGTKRVVVVPTTETEEELADLQARLGFYLYPTRNWQITIPVSRALADRGPDVLEALPLPERFDPRIETLRRVGSAAFEYVSADSKEAVLHAVEAADVVLLRDSGAATDPTWARLLDRATGARIHEVDAEGTRTEGSQFIQAVYANSGNRQGFVQDSMAKFDDLRARLGTWSTAYLLATGPSIDRFASHDFSDGLVIACNTTVLDEELLDHARPRLLTFADPIFHFGCSRYAGEFRQAVRSAAGRCDFDIVIPMMYYELFTALEPTLASRVIGMPFARREINLDLHQEFEVKVIDNIATFLMLPLAGTFASSIGFLGFDGRKPTEDYFWRHNPRTQLNHLMENIRLVHPGFFELEYEDYYQQHCDNLAAYVQHAESLGKQVFTLEPSAIPVLATREGRPSGPPPPAPENPARPLTPPAEADRPPALLRATRAVPAARRGARALYRRAPQSVQDRIDTVVREHPR